MIAKILKPTKNFSGILYSELKINEGKAFFSGAFNFPFKRDFTPPEVYLHYLENLAACAQKSVKNRQFHAIISTKGKEHNKIFLTELAQKWMQKMGYGEQPYLVYFHEDTEHNHVHIVSCRIDKDGQRINPYMEGRRAGIAISELMNENLKEKAQLDMKEVLDEYSFSTISQYRLVLEDRGWKTNEKEGRINLIKMVRQASIDKSEVLDKLKKYEQNRERIKQLRVIMNKYKGLSTEQLKKYMYDNFGVKIIFHKAKEYEKPYGYTVIDHNRKVVMKGSEIMPLEILINPVGREEHARLVNEIMQTVMQNKPLYSELKKVLNQNDYSMKKNKIFIKGDEMSLLQLSNEHYKQLRYNDRLREANEFTVRTKAEAKILSRYFFVRSDDIILHAEVERDDTAYREMISSFGNDVDALRDYMNEMKQVLISYNGTTLIMDMKNHIVADITGLGFESNIDLERYYERNRQNIDNVMESGTILAVLAGIFGMFAQEQPDEHERDQREKYKRKRQRTI
jgi:hypothetical protein